MSTIQINQLNQNSSEFTSLNDRETAEVVGGNYYGGYSSYYSYYSSKSNKNAVVKQANFNSTQQAALGGGRFSSNGNSNSTYQFNDATIVQ